MGRITFILLSAIFLFSCSQEQSIDFEKLTKENTNLAEIQYEKTITKSKSTNKVPIFKTNEGELRLGNIYNWTSGFFAGNLWYMYELTGDEKWKNEAIHYTEILDTIQFWTGNHDVGFMIFCSYGNGLRLSGNKDYEQVIVNTAESLSQRFNKNTGCIKSWNYRKNWDGVTEWFYPVIIDNMMNLEVMFEASMISGNPKYKEIAITHANTTMKNHYRDDYSCYHVVDYDTITGAVKDRATCQGFTDESSWSRGQAWGLYGYVLMYRYTKDDVYLDFAENIAAYIMNHPNMPEDHIPYWDYHVNQPGYQPVWDYNPDDFDEILRDVSASVIAASALMELAQYSTDGQKYVDYAKETVVNVSTPNYRATADEDNYFLLKKSVGSIPHGGQLSVPLNYADYYFLETLQRIRKYQK